MASFTGRTSGGVTSVTAADGSVTIAGTAAAPTVAVAQSFAFTWTAAHSFVVTDLNRTTSIDVLTLGHLTSDALFGGNGMGAAILFDLEADDGARENAGRIGFTWLDAGSASLDSKLSVSLMRAGTFAEQFTVGSATIAYQRDGAAAAGNGLLVDLSGNSNADLGVAITNSSAGAAADSSFNAINSSGDKVVMLAYSIGVGGNQFSVAAARQSSVYTTGSSPLTVGTIAAQTLTLGTNNTGRWQVGASSGDLVPFLTDTYDLGTSSLRVMDVWTGGRVHFAKGSDVASANDMTLGGGGISFDITGATQINTIASTTWQAGDIVILQFDGAPTVKHATAGTGAQLALAASVDFVASAGDTLGLWYDGAVWRELFRTVI